MTKATKLKHGQKQHDDWLAQQTPESMSELAEKAHALLRSKGKSAASPATKPSFAAFDPIEETMRRNPGLTREEATEMARAFGF